MTAFLVSLCNLGPQQSRRCLALIEPSGERWLLDLAALPDWNEATGGSGLARWGEGFMLALQGGERILELNAHLDIVASRPIRGGADLHGLCAFRDGLAAVSCGRDAILFWRPDEPLSPRVLYASGQERDALHINDICVHDGRLVACAFGLSQANAVRAGRVFDVESGASLIEGLREPHSVRSFDGALYCLESTTGRLYRAKSGAPAELVASFAGYTRGFAKTDSHMVVGRSAFRPRSRSRAGLDRKPAFDSRARDDAEHMLCGVYIGAADASRFEFVDLSDVASEIYDIAPVDMGNVRREALLVGSAMRQRELVMLVDQLRATIRGLQAELARRRP